MKNNNVLRSVPLTARLLKKGTPILH